MIYNNKKLEAYVRTLPCAVCGKPGPSHCHHIKGVGHLSGAGMKAPSWATIPLCCGCHWALHKHGVEAESQWEYALRTVGAAIEAGVLS